MKFLFTFLLLSISLNTFAQNVDSLYFYNNRNFTEVVERNNTLWILSTFGVVKFDKITKNYTYFDLDYSQQPNKNTKAATVDRNNNLWTLDRKHGLYKYDGQSWTHQDSMTAILDNISYFGQMFVTQNNEILVGSDIGLFQYYNNQWTNLSQETNAPLSAYKIRQDDDGTLWVTNGSLFSKTAGVWTEYAEQNTNLPISSSSVNYITIGNQNEVWFQVNQRALGQFNPTTGFHRIDFPFGTGGFTPYMQDLAVRPNGDVWIAFKRLQTYFICIWNGTEMLEIDPTSSPMVNNRVEKFYRDKDGSLWLLGNRGLDELRPNGDWIFHDISQAALHINYVRGVLSKKDGTTYVVTDEGISSFDWNSWKYLNSFNLVGSPWPNNDQIHIRKNYKEEVAIIHKGKLYLEDADSFKVSNIEIEDIMHSSSKLLDFEIEDNGRIWVYYRFEYLGGNSNYKCFYKDRNSNIWINSATLNWGFNVYEIATKRDGTLWFTSSVGLVKYDGQSIVSFPYPQNYMGNLAVDNNDNIWLSSVEMGTYLFDGQNFHKKTADFAVNMVFNSNNEMLSRSNLNSPGIAQKLADTVYIPTGYQRHGNILSICFDIF